MCIIAIGITMRVCVCVCLCVVLFYELLQCIDLSVEVTANDIVYTHYVIIICCQLQNKSQNAN